MGDAGLPESWNECFPWLEEWLNRSLDGAPDIGLDKVGLMLVIFTSGGLPQPPRPSRLVMAGEVAPMLALHVVIAPDRILATPASGHLSLLCGEVLAGLPLKPLRTPRGLDYARLRLALQACVRPFAEG